ncbi:hypothetical protein [Mycobacterium asiaticum]|uniref:hypothetical protein n=1 Tax=Mycobacterium asiaticum TaxID=1790 RepID=UPI0012DB3453|nr:hypothetical protein [Mycobacterium asiaticum]
MTPEKQASAAARWHAEMPGQALGPQPGQIGGHAAQDEVGEPAAESVSVRVAVDFARHRGGPLARAERQFGLRDDERGEAFAGVLAASEGDRFQNALGHVLPRLRRQARTEHPARQAQRFPFERVADPGAALAVGFEIEDRAEAAEGALAEHSRLAEMPSGDPFVGLFLPLQCEAGGLASAGAQHRAVGLRRLLEGVRGQTERFVEPVGVGQQRPEFLGRKIECPGPGAAHRLRL